MIGHQQKIWTLTYRIRSRHKVGYFFFFVFFCGGRLLGFEIFEVQIPLLEHIAFIIVNMVSSRS